MPYSITTEDGITLNNIPDDVPRDSDVIKRNVQKLRSQAFEARYGKQTPVDDTSMLGNLTKGIGAGFVGTGETTALGVAALLEEEDELAARRKIQDIATSLRPEGGDTDSISYGIGSALGSIAGFGAAAAGAAAIAPSAIPATVAGGTAAAALGVGAMAGEASERARAANATEDERNVAIRTAAPFGVLEALPLGRIFKSVDIPLLNKLVDKLSPEAVEGIGGRIQNAAITGGLEGAQEATSEIVQNLTEQQYNDLAETFGGTGESFGYGAAAGALLDLFLGGRKRGAGTTEDAVTAEDDAEASGQLKLFPDDDAPEFALEEAEGLTLSNEIRALENSGLTREQAVAKLAEELGTTEANIANVLPPISVEAEAARIEEEERQGDLFAQRSPKQLEMDVRPKTAGALPAPTPDADFAVSKDGTTITGKKSKKLEEKQRQEDEQKRVDRESYVRDMPREEVLDKRRQFEFEQRQREARDIRGDIQGDLFPAQLEDAELAELEAIVDAEDSSAEDIQLAEQVLASYGRKKIARERKKQAPTDVAPIQVDLLEDAAETAELEAMVAEDVRIQAEQDQKETAEIERLLELEVIAKENAEALRVLEGNIREREPKQTQQQLPLKGIQTKTSAKTEGVKRLTAAGDTTNANATTVNPEGSGVGPEDGSGPPANEEITANIEEAVRVGVDDAAQSVADPDGRKSKRDSTLKTIKGANISGILGAPSGKKVLDGAKETIKGAATTDPASGKITYKNAMPVDIETAQDDTKAIENLIKSPTPRDAKDEAGQAKNIAKQYFDRFLRPIDAFISLSYEIAEKTPAFRRQKNQLETDAKKFQGTGGDNTKKTMAWVRDNLSQDAIGQIDALVEEQKAASKNTIDDINARDAQQKAQVRTDAEIASDNLAAEVQQQLDDSGSNVIIETGAETEAKKTTSRTTKKIDTVQKAKDSADQNFVKALKSTRDFTSTTKNGLLSQKAKDNISVVEEYAKASNDPDARLTEFATFLKDRRKSSTEIKRVSAAQKSKTSQGKTTKPKSRDAAYVKKAKAYKDTINAVVEKFSKSKTLTVEQVQGAYNYYLRFADETTSFGTTSVVDAENFLKNATIKNIQEAAKANQIIKDSGLDVLELRLLPEEVALAMDSPLPESTVKLLNDGDLQGALEDLAKTTTNKRVRQVATALAKNVRDTKVTIGKMEGDVVGTFDPVTNTITLDSSKGVTAHTLLHEMTHAATSHILKNKSHPLTKQLTKLYNDVKGELDTAYGATSLEEFVSEAFSNPEFQQRLAGMRPDGTKITALDKFFRAVTNFVRRLIGMDTKPLDSALDQADAAIMAMLSPAPNSRNGHVLRNLSSPEGVKELAQNLKTQKTELGKATTKFREEFGKASLEFLNDLSIVNATKKLFLTLKGSQSLGDVAKAAGFGDLGLQLHTAFENQRGAMNDADDVVKAAINKVVVWTKKNPKAKEILDNLIYSSEYGATIYQVDPTLSKVDARKKYEGKTDESGNDLFKIWEKQQTEWNKLKASGGQKIYTDMRDFYKKEYLKLKKVMTTRIDEALLSDLDSLTPEQRASVIAAAEKLKTDVFAKMFNKATLDVYFPLVREGHYKLSYANKNATNPSDAYVVRMFTSKTERNAAKKELDLNLVDEKSIETSDGELKLNTFEKAPPTSFVGQVLTALSSRDRPDASSEEKKAQAELKDEIMNLFISTLPETSYAKSLKPRAGYGGYKEDSLYAMKSKGYELGRQAARIDSGAKIDKIQRDIIKRGKELNINEEDGMFKTGSVGLNYSTAIIANELGERAKFARNGAANKSIEGYVKVANQSAFIYTIGFNASSALVNLSQVPLFVMPMLSGKYGVDKTFTSWGDASSIVTAGKLSVKDLFVRDDAGNYTIKEDLPPQLKSKLKNLEPLIKLAAERGQLNNSYLADALGLEESGRVDRKGIFNKSLDAVSTLSAIGFNAAERYNRQVTLIMSYKLELAQYGKNPTDAQKQAAASEALYNTQRTNGGAVLETGAGIAQQNLGRTAFMYKNYGLQMYQTMFDTMFTYLDAVFIKPPNETAAQEKKRLEARRVARNQMIGFHGTAVLFAGIRGIPLYGAVSLLYNIIADDDEEDFDTIVRKYVSEGYFKGPLVEASGIDFSNRVRLSGLLIQENRYNTDPSPEEFLGFHFGGPAWSTGKRLYRAGKDLNEGEIERGLESLAPAGLTNAWRNSLGRYAREGEIASRRGDVIQDDLSFGQLASGFVGFPPAEYTFKQEQNMIEKKIDRTVNDNRTKLLRKYYTVQRTGDVSRINDTIEEMTKFNKKHPVAALTAKEINRSMKAHIKSSNNMHNGVTISPLMKLAMERSRLDYTQGFGDLY